MARKSTPPRGPSSTQTAVGVPGSRASQPSAATRPPSPVSDDDATRLTRHHRYPTPPPPPPPLTRGAPACADLDAVIIVYDVADAASQTTYATAHPEEPWVNELQSHFSWAIDTFRRDSADLEGGAAFGGGSFGSGLGSLGGDPSVASPPSTPPLGPGSGSRQGIAFA